jgi:prevent-host-death family protein
MAHESLQAGLDRVDEPHAADQYSEVLSRVAAQGKPVIVCRNGADLAAIIPLEHLALLREALAREQVERQAVEIDWSRAPNTRRPPDEWFGDTDNPFEPEAEPQS